MAKETIKKVKDKGDLKETVKKNEEKKDTKKVAKSTSQAKTESKSSVNSKNVNPVPKKKASTSKKTNTSKKSSTAKKSTPNNSKSKQSSSNLESTVKPMLAEYYDLPYRYNETVVKILAQTPTTLFVYWDISDADRNTLIEQYGENVFNNTKPILIVHNTTKNYSFELEINDFANSWYIRTQEPNCNYVIELGRKPIDNPNKYIYIESSNNIVSPNDHILFEKANLGNVLFRNVKTNMLSSKDFGSLRFINDIDKLYGNVYDVYSRLYKDNIFNELYMPSSGEFIMK